jgi:17beta-estradiol 17-dehydrogenase / very-long-chain 3-oxoacyl-CoA reductase
VSTATYAIDFGLYDEVAYEGFAAVANGLDIGVLGMIRVLSVSSLAVNVSVVNNVGRSHTMPVYFHETPTDEMSNILAININATLRITHSVLPGMIKRYEK